MKKNNEIDANLTIRINGDVKRRFNIIAKRKHRTGAELIREFVEKYILDNMREGDMLK